MVKRIFTLLAVGIFFSCNQEPAVKQNENIPSPTSGTVVKANMEEGGEREKREAWIELMHQSAPDVKWRDIESERAWKHHFDNKAENRLIKRSPEVTIADGRLTGTWIEKGSSNLSGSVIATAYDTDSDELYIMGAGGCHFKSTRDGDNWRVVNQDLRFGGRILQFIESNGAKRLLGIVDRAPAYSDDLGENWLQAEGWEIYNDSYGDIFSPVIHHESGHVLAMTKPSYWENLAVYVSVDGGESYEQIRELSSHDANKYTLTIEENSGRILLVDKVNDINIDFYLYDPVTKNFELESVSRDLGFGSSGVANLAAVSVNDTARWYYCLLYTSDAADELT